MGKDNTSNPVKTGRIRDKQGRFVKGVSGNPNGRPEGTGISITTEIKRRLQDVPEGQKSTYLELLINRILKQAIQGGDQQMIKNIWNYIDGMPAQKTDITSGGKPIPILGDVRTDHSDQETPTPDKED